MRLALYLFRQAAAWLCWLITLSYASLLTFTVFIVIIYWKKLSRFCYLLHICLRLEENEWNWKWKNSDFEPEFFDWGETKVKTLMILFYSGLYFLASPSVMLPPWYSLSHYFCGTCKRLRLILSEHLATEPVIRPCLWAFILYFLLCSALFSWFCAVLLTVLAELCRGEGFWVCFLTCKWWEPPSSNWGVGESSPWAFSRKTFASFDYSGCPLAARVTLKNKMFKDRFITCLHPINWVLSTTG